MDQGIKIDRANHGDFNEGIIILTHGKEYLLDEYGDFKEEYGIYSILNHRSSEYYHFSAMLGVQPGETVEFYTLDGEPAVINAETKEQKKRNIKPEETVWARYEEIFTQKYSIISEDYKKFLLKFVQEPYAKENDEAYVRAWTKPVTAYAKNYSKFDISLAPIKNHIFNEMKSQLKVIEAGFYKKAVIINS